MRVVSPWPVHTLGAPERPALVLLHGFMGRGSDWFSLADRLSSQFHCLMPDLPGHGDNLGPVDESVLGYEALVEGLRMTLSAYRPGPVNLLGYSMGGRLGMAFSLRYPEYVSRLILESANPGIAAPRQRAARAALDDRLSKRIQDEGLPAFLDFWYRLPLFALDGRRPDLLAKLVDLRAQNDQQWMAAVVHCMSPGRQPNLWPRLGEISAPTLLLAGALDKKYSAITARMAETIVGSRRLLIPFAGHSPHIERPARIVWTLEAFLSEK
ncbi:MAG: 2-succinyl-6-hydroxy-2,4-cyclohexadiene-1-carboxylate synthase [Chloroflexi bacterium]|nr:2-succinyl-6-hydroxy-2,4-cyclohexadiene-1-carboxylate synthase [Chloroflexota bacterium]